MRVNASAGVAKGAGENPIFLWARVVGVNGVNPTITHGFGISAVRTNEGIYTFTIDKELKPSAWTVFASYIENDTANFHEVVVTEMNESAGTFVVRHRFDENTAYAAPVADDVIDFISVMVVGNR
jgi:hypothetical protein